MPQNRPDHLAKWSICVLGEPVGPPGRLRPVLAVLVVRVGRRPNADSAGIDVLQAPDIGTARMDTDGQVVHDPQAYPSSAAGLLSRGELLIQLPLQPAFEVDLTGMVYAELLDCRRIRVLQLWRPIVETSAMMRGQHRPRREVLQASTLPPPVCLEGDLAAGTAGNVEDYRQRLALRLPSPVTIDGCSRIEAEREFLPAVVDLASLFFSG